MNSKPPSTTSPSATSIRRPLVTVAITAVLIGAIQWVARDTDHQFANFGCYIVGVIGAITVSFQTARLLRHRFPHSRAATFAVPVFWIASFATAAALFRFDGFSGEMVPQFASRFAAPRELEKVSPVETEVAIDDSAEAVALVDSSGFLGSNRDAVIDERRFDVPTTSPRVLWDIGIGEGWSSFAVVGDHAVTIEQRDEEECVSCYRLIDGKLLWIDRVVARHSHSLGGIGPRSTPTIFDGRVYSQGATGILRCNDLQSGEVVWSVDLLEMAGWNQIESEAAVTWGRAGSPLIVDGMCVVPFGGPDSIASTGRSLIALDVADGSVVWKAGDAQISYASPVVMTLAGKRQIVSVNEADVTGHAIEDGRTLWQLEWFGQTNAAANCASVVPASEDRFIIGKGYGGGSALVHVASEGDDWEATEVWASSRVLKTKFTHACVDGDVAYAISNGSLEAVRVEDGKPLWKQPRGERLGQGQLLLVDDVLIGQNESGDVAFVAADADDYRLLASLPAMDAKTWNVPTVAGRHLIVRNDRQAICFLLDAVPQP